MIRLATAGWNSTRNHSVLSRHWFLVLALAIFLTPLLVRLVENVWSMEQGTQGPIILASGLWLLTHEMKGLEPAKADQRLVALLLAPALTAYIFSRIVGMLWLECLATYVALVTIFYAYVGVRVIRKLWFPLVYLLFLVPPPYFLIADLTNSRKLWLSTKAVDLLSAWGYDVARSGTTLYIDQYELLIANTCAGINSLFSLLAIGSFYIYVLHRADWRYCAILALCVFPIAMIANLVRVVMLMLVTHYFGDAAAQGPIHEMAGLVMFAVALICLAALDFVLTPLRRRLEGG